MNETINSDLTAAISEGIKYIGDISIATGDWQHFLFIVLALLGVISILSTIFSKATQAIGLFIKIFVLIPAIIIINLFNKKKREKRLKVWGEFHKDLKKSKKKVSKGMRVLWFFLKIILPLLIVGNILFRLF